MERGKTAVDSAHYYHLKRTGVLVVRELGGSLLRTWQDLGRSVNQFTGCGRPDPYPQNLPNRQLSPVHVSDYRCRASRLRKAAYIHWGKIGCSHARLYVVAHCEHPTHMVARV